MFVLKNLWPVLLSEQAMVSSDEVTMGVSKVSETDSLELVFSTFVQLPTPQRDTTHIRNSKFQVCEPAPIVNPIISNKCLIVVFAST